MESLIFYVLLGIVIVGTISGFTAYYRTSQWEKAAERLGLQCQGGVMDMIELEGTYDGVELSVYAMSGNDDIDLRNRHTYTVVESHSIDRLDDEELPPGETFPIKPPIDPGLPEDVESIADEELSATDILSLRRRLSGAIPESLDTDIVLSSDSIQSRSRSFAQADQLVQHVKEVVTLTKNFRAHESEKHDSQDRASQARNSQDHDSQHRESTPRDLSEAADIEW